MGMSGTAIVFGVVGLLAAVAGLARADVWQGSGSNDDPPTIGSPDMVWNYGGIGTTYKASATSSFASVNDWVNGAGFILDQPGVGATGDSFDDILGPDAKPTHDVVFRPGDFTGQHAIFGTGENLYGTILYVDVSTLILRFQSPDNTDNQGVTLFENWSTLDASGNDFIHVMAVVDVPTDAPPPDKGIGTLYVDGVRVVGPTYSDGMVFDWDGSDAASLGSRRNQAPWVPSSTDDDVPGDNTVPTPTPIPSAFVLGAMGLGVLVLGRRLRRLRQRRRQQAAADAGVKTGELENSRRETPSTP